MHISLIGATKAMEAISNYTNNGLMQEALQRIKKVASSEVSVVICGERGTGKEWAARLIHEMSGRSFGPFCAFDCVAVQAENFDKELLGYESISWDGIEIRKGALEEAAEGTLMIDDANGLPTGSLQRIARLVEHQTFRRIGGSHDIPLRARVIATVTEMEKGNGNMGDLREEFFYRMGAISIELPPLRKRRDDIPLLVRNFLLEFETKQNLATKGISEEALQLCAEYHWPGNVRQLKSAIEYAAIISDHQVIFPDHLPAIVTAKKAAKVHRG